MLHFIAAVTIALYLRSLAICTKFTNWFDKQVITALGTLGLSSAPRVIKSPQEQQHPLDRYQIKVSWPRQTPLIHVIVFK